MKHYSIALVAALFLIQPFISEAQNAIINVQSSSVEWAAGKIVGGDHNGTIESTKAVSYWKTIALSQALWLWT